MKTAEFWDAKSQLTINKISKEYRIAIYKECQLEAYKAGLKAAVDSANQVELTLYKPDPRGKGKGYIFNQEVFDAFIEIEKRILALHDSITELPKRKDRNENI